MNTENNRSVLSRSIKSTLVLIGLFITVYFSGVAELKQWPELEKPKLMTYNWSYAGRPYSLSVTVYESVYLYYNQEPKGLFIGEEESSLKKYLIMPVEDNSIKEVTSKLSRLAAENGLSDDQQLELAVSFVQNIPYDVEKAKTDRTHPRYAYEVLYENKGICTDKSFLMLAILKQMGYGGAIFEYPKEEHMNVGVYCDPQYSTDNSSYTMIETTNPKMKIGVIPSIDAANRQALENQSIQEFNLRNPNTTSGKHLSSPEIYGKTTGKKYYGIIQTYQDQREIADIQNYLAQQKPVIEQKNNEIIALEQRMDSIKAGKSISAYNSLVPFHNRLVKELEPLISEFNAKVNRYNALIALTFQ